MTKPNINQTLDKLIKAVAFFALFTSSAYGVRSLLASIQEPVSVAVTSLLVVFTAYIIFRK